MLLVTTCVADAVATIRPPGVRRTAITRACLRRKGPFGENVAPEVSVSSYLGVVSVCTSSRESGML